MSGVEDLDELIASMSATVRPGRFVYAAADPLTLPAGAVLASVLEDEGWSVVVRQETADAGGLPYDFVAGWITLQVHSALTAVGLTAAVAAALTEAGVSCNVVAGLRHDHLLVPVDRTDEAVEVLRGLSARGGG